MKHTLEIFWMLVSMAVNWWERKDAGVDAQEGILKDSISPAVLFLRRSFKPPDVVHHVSVGTLLSLKSRIRRCL